MKARFGWIKPSQVNKAVELLKSGWIYEAGGNLDGLNIWVERPHQGDNVRGAFFKDRVELIDADRSFYQEYNDLTKYLSECEENECEPDEAIVELLKKGFTAYEVSANGSIVGDDKNTVIDAAISDGQGSQYFTIPEAIEALEDENYNETLAIWLLKFVSENDEE